MTTIGLVGLHPDLKSLVAEILRDEGLNSLPFPLHGETPAVVSKLHMDVLVLDGHPFSNAIALIEALRTHESLADVPIILLTSTEHPALHTRHGPVTQVLMPFALDAFVAAIHESVRAS